MLRRLPPGKCINTVRSCGPRRPPEARALHSYPVASPAAGTLDAGRRSKGHPQPTPHPGGTRKSSISAAMPVQAACAPSGHHGRPVLASLLLYPAAHPLERRGLALQGQVGPIPEASCGCDVPGPKIRGPRRRRVSRLPGPWTLQTHCLPARLARPLDRVTPAPATAK